MKNMTLSRSINSRANVRLTKWCSVIALGLVSLSAVAEGVDNRQVLILTEPQRHQVLTEMRNLLAGTQDILGAIVQNDMAAVAKSAHDLGFEMSHKAENQLHAVLPKAFMQLGMPMHKEFDQIAADAESLKDAKHTLQQLNAAMGKCTACHATYQIRTSPTTSEARLDEVAERGRHVMPFNLEQTTHVFSKTTQGGRQQVIVKDPGNTEQIKLIREHLSKITAEFKQGDFSNPAKIHGDTMPGLAELRQAKRGEMAVVYKELPNGAEINYTSKIPVLIQAIHQWFDAQLSDHARHATAGHMHQPMHKQ
jgi:hypothetical protein